MKSLKEKCGVVGVWGAEDAAHLTYLSLFALQHRGQEGAGIVSCDSSSRFRAHRGEGLVSQIFPKERLQDLPGSVAIGHVRYSTAGGSLAKNLQPLWVQSLDGDVAMAHNGNLTNALHLRRQLEAQGSVFQTSSDTETILHLMAQEKGSARDRLTAALKQVEGAFSLVVLVRDGAGVSLFAAKDPQGFRPLVVGQRGETLFFASETCAFDLVGADYLRELAPGEMVEISKSGMESWIWAEDPKPAPCIFEWIYFSRPDSTVFHRSVYEVRKKLGELLADQDAQMGLRADLVMGVPDSGIPAAIGYAQKSGLPFELGLIRNHYIGRTFIEPHQSVRDFGVRIKQNPLKETLRGKRVVIVDDSLVRGTTAKKINQILREAGVREIHMRISAPPTVSPCYYGIDTPAESELLAARKTVDEVSDFVAADSVRYLSIESIREGIGLSSRFCDACFTKDYPVPPRDQSA
jgi:amidophosphoribosyltransferase